MNDKSVKIEECLKEVAGSPSTLTGADNEFDPLALDEGEAGAVKESKVEESPVVKSDEEKTGNCDDDAKEKNLSETQNGEANKVALKTENVEEAVKETCTTKLEVATKEEVTPKEEATPKVEVTPKVNVEPELDCSAKTTDIPDTATKVEESKPKSPTQEPVAKVQREPSPVKETKPITAKEVKVEVKTQEPEPDQEMTEVPKEEKIEQKIDRKPKTPMNGDIPKGEQGTKRRSSEEIETESPLKKLCQEVEKTFPHHDSMINDYIQTATKNNVDEVQRHTEQLLSEIQTLRELAQKKEHEWNSILHLKKVKEEILLRLLRKKQVLSYEKSPEVNGQDPFDYLNQAKNLAIDKSDEISGLALKQPGATVNPMMQPPVMPMSSYNPMAGLPPPYDKAHLQNMPKPVFPQQLMLPGPMQGFPRDMNGQLPGYGLPMGRQGPTKDVKSIIADYRQRNPDITPRRGRRMKSILNPNMMNAPRPIAPKMDSLNNLNNLANMTNMANMNNLNNINMIFNNLDMSQKAMIERLQQVQGNTMPNGMSFKDVLVQFANMQQNNPALIPNRVENIPIRPEQHIRPENRRRPERNHEEPHKPVERLASPSPRLPPPPPYPEISLLPVSTSQEPSQTQQQNSLLHGILTKQASPAPQSFSPTLAKLLTSPERKQGTNTSLPTFGQAKNCGEITITPVQPTPPPPETQPEKTEEVVQLDDDESPASEGEASGSPSGSGSGRLVIDEGGAAEGAEGGEGADDAEDRPLCQGCRRRDAQFVCAGCANQWYCSRDCQVAAWDDHSEMCSG